MSAPRRSKYSALSTESTQAAVVEGVVEPPAQLAGPGHVTGQPVGIRPGQPGALPQAGVVGQRSVEVADGDVGRGVEERLVQDGGDDQGHEGDRTTLRDQVI